MTETSERKGTVYTQRIHVENGAPVTAESTGQYLLIELGMFPAYATVVLAGDTGLELLRALFEHYAFSSPEEIDKLILKRDTY